ARTSRSSAPSRAMTTSPPMANGFTSAAAASNAAAAVVTTPGWYAGAAIRGGRRSERRRLLRAYSPVTLVQKVACPVARHTASATGGDSAMRRAMSLRWQAAWRSRWAWTGAVVALLGVGLALRTDRVEATPDTQPAPRDQTYETVVRPFFAKHCLEC